MILGESFFYSLHQLYDAKTGLLTQEAIILHGKDGRILRHDLSTELNLDGGV